MAKAVSNPKIPTTYSIETDLRTWLREKSDATKVPASYFVNEALKRLKALEDEKSTTHGETPDGNA